MKRILITGINGYIGNSLYSFLKQYSDYGIDGISVRGNSWKGRDFSDYHCIVHAAGIAHIKETKQNKEMYYIVNRDLTFEIAKKAKAEGVKQFIFISSISVYGIDTGEITKSTIPYPKTHYAKSKFQAEEKLMQLADDEFGICILRPPMVYGKNCKGNFPKLVKLIKLFPVFPKINNRRSLIFIDNLCKFISICIEHGYNGFYFPQNCEYVRTESMMLLIADQLGKKIYLSKFLGMIVWTFRPFVRPLRKAFGSLIYKEMNVFEFAYCMIGFEESIKLSVGEEK